MQDPQKDNRTSEQLYKATDSNLFYLFILLLCLLQL